MMPRRPRDRRGTVLAVISGGEAIALLLLDAVAAFDPLWSPVQLWLTTAFGFGGAYLVGRQPANRVSWILWLIGALYGLDSIASNYAITGALIGVDLPGTVLAAWFANWSLSLVLALALGFLPFLFPDGWPPSVRWGRLVPMFVAVTVLVPLGDLLHPGDIQIGPARIPNPTGLPGPVDDVLTGFGNLVPLVLVPLVIASAVSRFRRGTVVERQQMKWFTAAAALTGIGLISVVTLGQTIGPWTLVPTLVALGLVPIAVGVAVLRYRLYEIDRIVSRTLGWAIVTGLLAAMFAVAVGALDAILAGLAQGQTLAVAASTLGAFAAFQPVRRRVQRVVDRRFDRSRYDATTIVAAFAGGLRDETDLDGLSDRIRGAAAEAVKPASSSVWLRSAANRATRVIP